MSKHTPGPWEITKDWLSIQAYPPCDVVRICANPQGGFGDLHSHNWRANARLIAAAPDMLGALVDLIAALEWNGLGNSQGKITDSMVVARDAIAKATGANP